MRPEELETIATALRELSLSYEETTKLMSGVTKDAKTLGSLWVSLMLEDRRALGSSNSVYL